MQPGEQVLNPDFDGCRHDRWGTDYCAAKFSFIIISSEYLRQWQSAVCLRNSCDQWIRCTLTPTGSPTSWWPSIISHCEVSFRIGTCKVLSAPRITSFGVHCGFYVLDQSSRIFCHQWTGMEACLPEGVSRNGSDVISRHRQRGRKGHQVTDFGIDHSHGLNVTVRISS